MAEEPSRLVDKSGPLELSERETRVLELFDRLQELQYQLALSHAQNGYHQDDHEEDQQLELAQRRLLESKASHALRNNIVNSVMMVNPTLQAVHLGSQASPIERDLLPFVEQRDAIATEIAVQAHDLKEIMESLAQAEIESLQVHRENVELAAEVTRLADVTNKPTSTDTITDLPLKEEITRLENAASQSKRTWEMAKETASAITVGSGFDWVRDQRLREMVLGPDR